jgi:hypothetical protein
MNEMDGVCSACGGEESGVQGFGGKPEGKGLLGRARDIWEDIKMDLQEVESGAWIGLICLKIGTGGGLYECGNEASGSLNCGEFLD